MWNRFLLIAKRKQEDVWKKSKKRIRAVNISDIPKYIENYNENKECFVCGKKLIRNQRFTCSTKCAFMLKMMLDIFSWSFMRRYILVRDEFTCQQCGRQLTPYELDIDHIIPISEGGHPFDPKNLQTLCKSCHITKTRMEKERQQLKNSQELEKLKKLLGNNIIAKKLENDKWLVKGINSSVITIKFKNEEKRQ